MKSLNYNIVLDAAWAEFGTRINKICRKFDINKKELAEIIDVNSNRLSQINGRPHEVAARILLAYPDISARWLLFGHGEMMDNKEVPATKPEPTPIQQPSAPMDNDASFYKFMYLKDEETIKIKDKEREVLVREFSEKIGAMNKEIEYLRQIIRTRVSTSDISLDDTNI